MTKFLRYNILVVLFITAFFHLASAQQGKYSDLIITEMEIGTAIEWTTFNEKDIKSFIIEKSTDAQNFEEVVTLAALENDNVKKGYSFVDLGLGSKGERAHYRVKSVHKDGIVSHGKMASITKEYQNHFTISNFEMDELANEYVLYFLSIVEGDLQMDVVSREDASIVHTELYNASIGFNKLDLGLNVVAAGKYELIFTLDDETESLALIKSGAALPENLMSRMESKKSNN